VLSRTFKITLAMLLAGLWLLLEIVPALAGYRPTTNDEGRLAPTFVVGHSTFVLTTTHPFTREIRPTGYLKGLYITYYGMASEEHRARAQELLENTELNAIVMDVKGDFGLLPYTSTVPTALEIGAGNQPVIRDWPTWMQWFKERHIYTIARIVVFKDDVLAAAQPAWAVIDSATGGVWHDREKLGWVDPSREEVWDYNIALAVEAAQLGFDEVQFDYVRFPTDGSISRATFAVENTEENRTAAITGFLAKARQALAPYPVKLAADVFGYTTWRTDDMGIGQQIETIAPYLDVLSPMLYPSTFAHGLPGLPEYNKAIAFPYEIVNQSTRRAVERLSAVNPQLEVRPWIQDFPDYAFDGRSYTPGEIRLQMEGVRQAGGRGWLLWDPRVQYTPAALVSAQPSYRPNRHGHIMVLEYHLIGQPEERWQRTPANFRADLERLWSAGYYPVNLRDLAAGDLSMVPAGKRPVVLTFDDSSIEQFRILPTGQVDPDSAVGILLDFHATHPADWPLRATFFVLQEVDVPERILFGQPELAPQKLKMLIEWGMEVGSHTISHADLAKSSAQEVKRQLALSQARLEELLPGYEVSSLSVPFGLYPPDERLLVGGMYEDVLYRYQAAVEVSGGLAPSPHAPEFDPYHIPRVQATQAELDYWLEYANRPGVYYVSPGE
jgi:peptidoglycan/xylan/chitin deacetylase (PgdA/CDA1 family)